MQKILPFFVRGRVVKGFGRGSKTLGTPTANFDQNVVETLPEGLKTGIYFGWAQVDDGPVYEMVGSIGWNPYFRNKIKSMETHVLHNFEDDFYGSDLRVCLVGYIRDEMDFKSLDELKEAIANDINVAKQELRKPEYKEVSQDTKFFHISPSSSSPITLSNGVAH